MSKRIMTLLMAATLAGSLIATDAQARGGGGGGHMGGLGGGHISGVHIGGDHIGGFHGMHIPSELGDTHIGSHFGGIRMGGGLGHEIHGNLGHDAGNDYSIITPEKGSKGQESEPWLAPRYKSPRGTVKSAVIPKSMIVTPPSASVPPSVFVPQTGQTFPNLPTVSGSGPGGAETFQDRAARCAHQAGVYGQATGGSYMGACVNQL